MSDCITRKIFGICNSSALFVEPWQTPKLFEYMLSLANTNKPKICYVGAAQGDDPKRTVEYYELTARLNCEPTHFSFYRPPTLDLTEFFTNQDIIYLDGGSTRNLLAILNEWNAIDPLISAYQQGTVLAGASAGISLWFDKYLTDSFPKKIMYSPGIGLLSGTICVHYDVRLDRQTKLLEGIQSGQLNLPALALDDGSAVLFQNEKINKVVTIDPRSQIRQYREGSHPETPSLLKAQLLGSIIK